MTINKQATDKYGEPLKTGDKVVVDHPSAVNASLGKIFIIYKLRWSNSRKVWRAYVVCAKNGISGKPIVAKGDACDMRKLVPAAQPVGDWASLAKHVGWAPTVHQ